MGIKYMNCPYLYCALKTSKGSRRVNLVHACAWSFMFHAGEVDTLRDAPCIADCTIEDCTWHDIHNDRRWMADIKHKRSKKVAHQETLPSGLEEKHKVKARAMLKRLRLYNEVEV